MHIELIPYLWDAAAFLVVLLLPLLLVIALRGARYLAKLLKVTDPSEVAMLEWSARQAVLHLEEKARKHLDLKGEEKKAQAIVKTRSLMPDGGRKHSDEQVGVVIDAQVAQLLHSIPPAPHYSLPASGRNSLNPPDG